MKWEKNGMQRRPLLVGAVLFGCAVLFCLLTVLLGAVKAEQREGRKVLAVQKDSKVFLLTAAGAGGSAKSTNKSWLAVSAPRSAVVLELNSRTGEELCRADFTDPLFWAAPRGGSLFVCTDLSGNLSLSQRSLDGLSEKSLRELPIDSSSLRFFDCDGEGRVFSVFSEAPDILKIWEIRKDGGWKQSEKRFQGEIQFLEVTPGGLLCIYAEDELFFSDSSLNDFSTADCRKPCRLLGEAFLLQEDGGVRGFLREPAELMFRCPIPADPKHFCAFDQDNRLVLPDGDKNLLWYTMNGTSCGAMETDGPLSAVGEEGAVYQKDGWYWYAPYERGEAAEPGPGKPTPGLPSPGPDDIQQEGEYILVPLGLSVEKLSLWFAPDSVIITSASGERVTTGRAATGMTAGSYTVVVLGDCNGSGTINGADVRAAQEMALSSRKEKTACFRAADLDGDGQVSSLDLILLGNFPVG